MKDFVFAVVECALIPSRGTATAIGTWHRCRRCTRESPFDFATGMTSFRILRPLCCPTKTVVWKPSFPTVYIILWCHFENPCTVLKLNVDKLSLLHFTSTFFISSSDYYIHILLLFLATLGNIHRGFPGGLLSWPIGHPNNPWFTAKWAPWRICLQ